ncbi:MAG: MoaD/ThiS family protein [Eubacteriaceae bacterium]|nr:MoaD/ThiS family protein [Eubacteriaceae bacterium]
MIVFNNCEFDFVEGQTAAELVLSMYDRKIIQQKAILLTINNRLVPLPDMHHTEIRDGDVLKTRPMPAGG